MAAKHSVRVFGTARFVMSVAVAILVLLVVWVAVRAVGPAEAAKGPTMVLPSVARVTIAPPPPTPASSRPTPSRTPSRSAKSPESTPAPRTTTSVPKTTRTTSKPPRTTTAPPVEQPEIEATVAVTASWDEGYVAMGRVTNEGERPVAWKVTITHDDQDNLRLRGVWNASGKQSGDTFVLTGRPLEPGQSASFGYQTTKDGRGGALPSGCNAVGGTCRVR